MGLRLGNYRSASTGIFQATSGSRSERMIVCVFFLGGESQMTKEAGAIESQIQSIRFGGGTLPRVFAGKWRFYNGSSITKYDHPAWSSGVK